MDTGVRRGEACGLRWKDIDFTSGAITIAGNLCYTPEKGIDLDTPKGKRIRTVYAGPQTISLLRQLRIDQAGKAISQYVFTKENSPKPMHPQTPTAYMKTLSERYSIPDLHPHRLRHSFTSIAIINGADVVSVSERLGHSDTAVTLRMYAHVNEESIRRAGQIVRDALKAQGQ